MYAREVKESRLKKKSKAPSRSWVGRFVKKWQCKLKKPNQLDWLRATSTSQEDLVGYFDLVKVKKSLLQILSLCQN